MKCLIFDIWGDYGHYRKFYTTSSPLTFALPPRTAIAGMIAAIVGIDKEEYLKYFRKSQAGIAVRLMKPVKKTRISYNLIDTKTAKMMSKIQNRTQVTIEVIKDCGFRIYFTHSDETFYNSVKSNLEKHNCYYTPCMGLSEFIAGFKYFEECELVKKENSGFVHMDSVIPFNENTIKVEFEEGKEYFKDTMPNEMTEDREVTEYVKLIYEKNCKPIKCNPSNFYESKGGEKIVFL